MSERDVPKIYEKCYKKAMSGKSKAAGIKAFCQECVGYIRNEVALCTDTGCPLYPYRPYKKVKKNIDEDKPIVDLTENPQNLGLFQRGIEKTDQKAVTVLIKGIYGKERRKTKEKGKTCISL